jgi:fructose-1,6-bisphosphatase/inositol monophosphatase family enzyme
VSGTEADYLEAGRLAAGLTGTIAQIMRQAAAQAIMPHFRSLKDGERDEKSAGEVVTVADCESEAMLSEALARLLPEASIVGEEAVHSDPKLLGHLCDRLCWIIDPLDGPGYFADGIEPFGIIVALASRGRAIGGWIMNPLTGRLCWAAAGAGCWIGGRRLELKKAAQERRTIGLSALLQRRPERFAAARSALRPEFDVVQIPRCAAAHYPAMLLHGPELTFFERTLAWDHAAGALLIEEAGGRVARLDGSAYRVDDDKIGLLAAVDPILWSTAASLLQNLPD